MCNSEMLELQEIFEEYFTWTDR